MKFKLGDWVIVTEDDIPWKKGEILQIKQISKDNRVVWGHGPKEDTRRALGVYTKNLKLMTKLDKALK